MDLKDAGKELLGCISLDEKKVADLLVEKIVLHALKKVVEDSSNPFDDQAYALLAPLVGPKIEEALAEALAEALGKIGA